MANRKDQFSKVDRLILSRAGFKLEGSTIKDPKGYTMSIKEVQAFFDELKKLGLYQTLEISLLAEGKI